MYQQMSDQAKKEKAAVIRARKKLKSAIAKKAFKNAQDYSANHLKTKLSKRGRYAML